MERLGCVAMRSIEAAKRFETDKDVTLYATRAAGRLAVRRWFSKCRASIFSEGALLDFQAKRLHLKDHCSPGIGGTMFALRWHAVAWCGWGEV